MNTNAKARRKAKRQASFTGTRSSDDWHPLGNEGDGNRTKPQGGVTVVDRFTGEVRKGGSELLREMFSTQAREREMFLASDNPCYLVGRVKQNEGGFDAAEIKRMVDATFECACRESHDVWYPNQYALGLAHSMPGGTAIDVGYFLSNFELGLRTSGERAMKRLGKGDWLKESTQLAARLKKPDALNLLTGGDYRDIAAYVAGHPRFSEAMSWYERGSGKQMQGGDAPSSEKTSELNTDDKAGTATPDGDAPESQDACFRQETLADVAMWQATVKSKGRERVIDDLVRGNFCTWLDSDVDHKLFIRASNADELRALLRPYSDGELGEWLSLMTTVVLAQTMLQVGMQWKRFGRKDPVLLAAYPSLNEFRRMRRPMA